MTLRFQKVVLSIGFVQDLNIVVCLNNNNSKNDAYY